jgi:hypothetical protein
MRWQLRRPDGGPGGQVKGLFSQGIYSRGELDNSSRLDQTRAKGSRLENTSPLIRKSYSLFLGVMGKKGVADDNDDDDE